MCLLSHSGFGGSRVVVTLYALELGANQFTVGLLMALYALVPMLLAVAIGRFADRIGARIPMLLGTSGVAIARVPRITGAFHGAIPTTGPTG